MENLDTPPHPLQIKDGKIARFRPSRSFILGDGGLLFHFILSKIVARF